MNIEIKINTKPLSTITSFCWWIKKAGFIKAIKNKVWAEFFVNDFYNIKGIFLTCFDFDLYIYCKNPNKNE